MTGCSEFASRWSDRAGASIYEVRRTFLTAVELEHVKEERGRSAPRCSCTERTGGDVITGGRPHSTQLVAAGASRASDTTFATTAHTPSRLA